MLNNIYPQFVSAHVFQAKINKKKNQNAVPCFVCSVLELLITYYYY